jgi:hypothetical protein
VREKDPVKLKVRLFEKGLDRLRTVVRPNVLDVRKGPLIVNFDVRLKSPKVGEGIPVIEISSVPRNQSLQVKRLLLIKKLERENLLLPKKAQVITLLGRVKGRLSDILALEVIFRVDENSPLFRNISLLLILRVEDMRLVMERILVGDPKIFVRE